MEKEIENHYEGTQMAQLYDTYRPYYPQEVFDKIIDYHNKSKHCSHQLALDVCCGPGRGTIPLTKYFTKVVGVDASSDQLKYVPKMWPHLKTELASAEELYMFRSNEVDLLSIAMGLHYVDVLRFFAEVRRILKPGGTFVAYGYSWDKLEHQQFDDCMKEIRECVNKYCSPMGNALFMNYKLIQFPFSDLQRYDDIKMSAEMTLNQYIGWLRSVHLTHLYDDDNVNEEPIAEQARKRLETMMDDKEDIRLKTTWSVFMILGRKD